MIITANLTLLPSIKIKRTFQTVKSADGFSVVTDWLEEGEDILNVIQTTLHNNEEHNGRLLVQCWEVIRMDVQCYTNHNIEINSTTAIIRRALTLNNITIDMDNPAHKAFWRLLVTLTWFYVEARQS